MSDRPILFVMRVMHMHKVHPQTDFSHNCGRCRKAVGIYPSGQKVLRDHPNTEIVCDVCARAGDPWAAFVLLATAEKLPGVDQERRESVDVAKRKQ